MLAFSRLTWIAHSESCKSTDGVNKILHNAFGIWIPSLLDAILAPNLTLAFEGRLEAFFWIIESFFGKAVDADVELSHLPSLA